MASVTYEEIYSRFYAKASAYDFLDLDMETVNEMLQEWLSSVCSKPYTRRIFKSFIMERDIHEIRFEMKYTVDEDTDKEFLIEILAIGLILSWLEPKINNITLISQTYSSKEEKYYSEANHLKELRNLKDSLYKEQRSMIADRGCSWNTYLDGGMNGT